jgi:hypothetical protein
MPRKTLADYSPALQAQIVAGLHPRKPAVTVSPHFWTAPEGEPGNAERHFIGAGLPRPVTELVFAKPRRWRFDYAWPQWMIALEVEGAVWTQGRHTRGSGFVKDMAKYNAAAVLGWRVVRCTPSTVTSPATIDMLRKLLT